MTTTRFTRKILPLLIILLLPASLFAASILKQHKDTYESSLGNIVTEHGNSTISLYSKYILSLEGIEERARKSGKLEHLLAVKAEIKRFKKEKIVPKDVAPEDYSYLAKAQQMWISKANEIEIDRAKRIIYLVDKYNNALEALQKKLIQDGKISEAVAVKAERDRIDADSDIASAIKFIEELKKAKTEKQPLRAQKPTLTPSIGSSLPLSIRKGLVLHYSFSLRSAKDSSRKMNTGKLSGGTWITKSIVGTALEFDGHGDFIDVGNPESLQITGDQTIAMWICPASLNDRRNPYNKAYGGEGTMTLEPGGTINYYYGTAGDNADPYTSISMSNPLKIGEWSHIVLVRDLENMKMIWYKNGNKVSEKDAPYPAATASKNPLYIGKGYTNPFHGMLDEIMVFDRALSPQDVGTLFRSISGKTSMMSLKPGIKASSR